MGEIIVNNPFIVGKYVSDKYFCDRDDETSFLFKQIDNGRNVALISPRRLGKSGLIHHLFNQSEVKNHFHVFYIDIYATSSLAEFVYLLGKSIYEELKPSATAWKERFFQIISSLRIGFKFDPITGMPGLELGLGDITSPQTTLDEIFRYLEQADKRCVIAIDEFQQIGSYAEKNVEALLRTKIQQCTTTQFIFAGSNRNMMSLMFNSPSKPFYQSAISMELEAIPIDTYADFAMRLFNEHGKSLSRDVVQSVWKAYDGCTWFVQMLLNELYAMTPAGGKCEVNMLEQARQDVIMSQEASYKDLLMNVPPKQKIVLQAIAKEGIAVSVTSSRFIKKYNLSSASSVQSAVKMLLKADILTQLHTGSYRIYDYFFSEWLSTKY